MNETWQDRIDLAFKLNQLKIMSIPINILNPIKNTPLEKIKPLSKEEIEQVENSIFDLAFDLELESGIVINPVLENEAHYRYWLGALPFYDNVEKEGIVIG